MDVEYIIVDADGKIIFDLEGYEEVYVSEEIARKQMEKYPGSRLKRAYMEYHEEFI
jgi:hypothetical protein